MVNFRYQAERSVMSCEKRLATFSQGRHLLSEASSSDDSSTTSSLDALEGTDDPRPQRRPNAVSKSSPLYVLVSGEVSMRMTPSDGDTREVYRPQPGEMFGVLSSTMGGSTANEWQATAASEVRAVSIPAELVGPAELPVAGLLQLVKVSYVGSIAPTCMLSMFAATAGRTNDLLHRIDASIEWRPLEASKHLFDAGDTPQGFYIVLSGRLVSVGPPKVSERYGRERKVRPIVRTYVRGDVIGERECLAREKYAENVVAVRDSELCRVTDMMLNLMG
ncbi:Neuropathy target esterase, partial [Perkinsus olseni]